MAEPIPVERRREIFAALVAAQFGLTAKTVEKIEKEGLEAQWPPFDA